MVLIYWPGIPYIAHLQRLTMRLPWQRVLHHYPQVHDAEQRPVLDPEPGQPCVAQHIKWNQRPQRSHERRGQQGRGGQAVGTFQLLDLVYASYMLYGLNI